MHKKLTAQDINEIWDSNVLFLDDAVGGSKSDFEIFSEGINTSEGIKKIIEAHYYLRDKSSGFFSQNNYDWCFDFNSYRLPAEASFQFRLLKMLVKLYEADPHYDFNDPIIVREAIVSSTFAMPRVLYKDGTTFIVFPLGWFDHVNYACHGLYSIEQKNQQDFRNALLGWCSKVLAQEAVDLFIDTHPEWNLPSVDYTLLILEIAQFLNKTDHHFSTAIPEIREDVASDFGQIIAYACESFTLAHEASHILVGDHKKPTNKGDEFAADDLAFYILSLSSGDIIPADIGITLPSLPVLAALSFIFIGNSSFEIQKRLNILLSNANEFRDRSLRIQELINAFSLPEEDKIKLKYFSLLAKQYLQDLAPVIDSVSLDKDQIIKLAYERIPQLRVD